jgi:hypothetical protein
MIIYCKDLEIIEGSQKEKAAGASYRGPVNFLFGPTTVVASSKSALYSIADEAFHCAG